MWWIPMPILSLQIHQTRLMFSATNAIRAAANLGSQRTTGCALQGLQRARFIVSDGLCLEKGQVTSSKQLRRQQRQEQINRNQWPHMDNPAARYLMAIMYEQ
ncbi:hypothetical protein LTR66_016845 [Elasticomyces elasticus]|nr:hypothetical protein LTR66_016845 [Elasticomyces elasticus]